MTHHSTNGSAGLEDLLEECVGRLEAGEALDVAAFAAAHPEHEEQLRRVLPTLLVLADLGRSVGTGGATPPSAGADCELASGMLGEFRILREVGRGGMGLVYEAEQASLGRRVALKVLPFAATMDPRQLQRFHNEARAAASLDHPHIVKVHAVGQERGVHYYAMQFIDGQTLADLIGQQRGVNADRSIIAHGPRPAADTAPAAAAATERAPRDRAYYRRVAEWGIQAAEALEHAHQLGVVHRDVKPANLMIDGHGKLWVADFGLARTAADSGLTVTGDLVGTLRYMSPEQALARHGLVDHRTDVYSLGATLYELLALRPVFDGADRQELLRQIAFEEPRPPRRINRGIPPDLETVVLKALEKSPADRFATAQELAGDLRRFCEDLPIRARRPSWAQMGRRWLRGHKPLMAGLAAALVVGLAVLAGSLGWMARDRAARRDAIQPVIAAALQESDSWQQQRRLPEALSAARRANGLLAGAEVDEALQQQVRSRQADLELLE
jgi:serine/threonine protein kinase